MRYAERDTIEEIQRRREQVINYLEKVAKPNDERSQSVIENLKNSMATDRAHLAELKLPD